MSFDAKETCVRCCHGRDFGESKRRRDLATKVLNLLLRTGARDGMQLNQIWILFMFFCFFFFLKKGSFLPVELVDHIDPLRGQFFNFAGANVHLFRYGLENRGEFDFQTPPRLDQRFTANGLG